MIPHLDTIVMLFILFSVVVMVFSKNLITSLIFLSLVSILLALKYLLLSAPDIAITEAALGSGLSTLVYIMVIKKVGGDKSD